MKVADLFAMLGMKVNKSEFTKADAALAKTRKATDDLTKASGTGLARALLNVAAAARKAGEETGRAGERAKKAKSSFGGLAGLFATVGAFFGLRAGKAALIDFNANVEDTKNKIAGMLSLTKKTNLTDELANADRLFANLQKRAASLPGTTQEYTNMLGQLVRPVTAAGLGMQDLEDITVNAVVAAKAFGVQWEVASRDIQQILQGQVTAGENQLAQSLGIDTAAKRKKFNAQTAAQRAAETKALLTQPQITQLAAAQGQTFTGVTSTLKDAIQQFFGKVGVPLFKALTTAVKALNGWIEKNAESINAMAVAIGGALVTAFGVVSDVIGFFVDNSDLAISLIVALTGVMVAFGIRSAAAWVMAMGPLGLLIAGITLIVFAFLKLKKHAFAIKEAFKTAFAAIASAARKVWEAIKSGFNAAFDFIAGLPVIKQLIQLVQALMGLSASASTKNEKAIRDAATMSKAEFEKAHPELKQSIQDAKGMYQQVPAARVPTTTAPAGGASSTTSAPVSNRAVTNNINVSVSTRATDAKGTADATVAGLRHALADRGIA